MAKFHFRAKIFKTLILVFSFLMAGFVMNAATITSTAAGGNWNATTTWVGGVVPTSADNVTIVSGAIVTMNVSFTANVGTTIIVNGRITFNKNDNSALTINGTINLNAANNSITATTGGMTGTSFNLSAGATLITPNVTGVQGGACAIQQNGGGFTANLNSGANYQFNGTAIQGTVGLPATVNSLTINNATGVNLTTAVAVTTSLTIGNITANSILNDNGKQITSTGTINLTSGTFNVGTGAANTSFPAFTANNILTGTTVNYNSSAAQTIAAVNYGKLTNTGNGARTLASSGIIGVKNTFTPSTGTNTIAGSTVDFNGTTAQTVPSFNYNNLTVTNTNNNITLAGSGIVGIAGTFTPNATSFGTITNSTVNFNGTAAQTIPSFTFNNLTINNSTGISSIGGDITVNQTLQLSSGIVTTGASKIIIPNGGSSNTGGGWIYGNLQKYFSAASNTNTFQVGGSTAGTYRPVTVNFTSVTTPGFLTVSQLPNAGSQSAIASVGLSPYLTPYWNLSSGGVAGTYDAIFTFIPGDGATATTVADEYTGGAWNTTTPGSGTTTSNQVTGLSTFGDFVFGTTTGIPQVTTQPSNVTICSTTTTTSFTAASTSKPTPTVKWQRSLDGGTTWVDITANLDAGVAYSGFTTNTLTLTGVTTLSGQINYKYRPIYTNLNGSSTNAVAATLIVTPAPLATIAYPASPYGNSDNNSYTPAFTGTSGGTFTASGGLIINSSTGAITPGANAAGTYTVTYTVVAAGGCSQFQTTASLTITLAPTVDISYVGNPFCLSVTSAQPVAFSNGQGAYSGGTFTSSPGGLTLNGTNGDITPGTSTAGSYTVTYNIPAAPPYPASTTTTQVTITAVPTASISYTGGPFCSSDQTPDPVTLTGTDAYMGGTYTASPSGLVIDATTGAITPFGSAGNTYTITYTTLALGGCSAVTATTSVTIVTRPSATISYTSSSFCQLITSAPATVTGTSGGTFSASPAGLIINGITGTITPGTSTPGDYIVTYTIPPSGPCGQVQITTNVSIVASPTGSIDYPNQPYCQTGGTKPVTLTGTDNYTGGTYTSTAGLIINSATGDITPSTSTPGTYTVTYTTPGCPVTFTTSVEIDAAPTAALSYANAPFCQSDGSLKTVTLTGDNSGTFSAPSGLSIDQNSGSITPSTSTPGTYLISYTIPAQGSCSAVTVTTSVTITALPTANISYAGTPFCTSISTPQPVTLSGTNAYTGGTYSSAPGLIISSTNGSITPNTSTPGIYTVTYTIPATGGCAAVPATTQVVITAAPTATITYSGPFCISDAASYTVNLSGTGAYSGGTFSSNPAGLSMDASGTISPSLSTAGTYIVTYTIPASAGCSSVPVTTSVTINADATIVLTSAATTTSQTLCINTAIVNIAYAIGGSGTGATVTGLPANVIGIYNSGTKIFTISGTPNVSGPFGYTVTTTGPCVNNSLSGTINVNANSTIALTSAPATTSQTPCINTAITNITYSIGGGSTGVTFSGLPANVTGSFSGGVATISGTPNVAGTYNYTITTTGPCVNPSSGGTIMVKPDATITLTSAAATTSQTPCINTAITPITYSIGGGGMGATFSGLPANVTGSFSGGTVTISGTPNISGTFNYTVNTTGICVQTSSSGSIIISPASIGGTVASNQIICQNSTPADLTLSGNTGSVVKWQKATTSTFTSPTDILVTSTVLLGSTIGALSTSTYFRAIVQSGNCTSVFSSVVLIAVNPPFIPIINASPSTTICFGQSLTLSTTGFNASDTIIDGDFSDPQPAGWTGQNNNANNNNGASPSDWGYTNGGKSYSSPYNFSTIPNAGNSGFMIVAGAINDILQTPSFSSVGRTSLFFEWYQGYSFNIGTIAKVEISINGGSTYTTLAQYTGPSTQLPTNPFTTKITLDLSAYLGQPSLIVRFNYSGTAGSVWAIDNVAVVGPYQPVTYTWPTGFTISGNGASATITPPVGTNTYTISTATGGCAATTTSVTITVNPTPAITAISTKTCSGTAFIVTPQDGTNGTVPLGTKYTWTAPVSSPIGAVTGGSAKATAQSSISQTVTNTTNAPATLTYTVTPLSGSCTGASFNVTVNVNPLPTALISASTPPNTCYGTISTILIEGTANATVTYSINGVAQSIPVTLNASGKANLTTGVITSPTTYTLTGVTSASPASCFKSLNSSVTITVNPGSFVWTGNTNTDWNTNSNWCSGTLPTLTSVVTIPSGVPNFPLISAGENASAASVTIAGSASLTMTGSGNLTITSSGTFNNSGTFSASGTGAVIFAGSGNVAGPVSFNNVIINGAVDFGSTGVSTVTGNLTINAGGSVTLPTTHLITYGSSSSLIYNTGTVTTVGNEWTKYVSPAVAGAGLPNNVIIQNNSTVTIANPNTGSWSTDRSIAGNLNINSGSTFNLSSNFDLYIAGNWTNNGSFNANGRTVTLNAFSASPKTQTIAGTTTFYNLTFGNSNITTDFGSSTTTVANQFNNNAGTMVGSTSTVILTGGVGTIIGGAAKNFYNLQINSGANITHTTGGGNVHIDNNYTNNGTYTEGATYTTYFDKNNGTSNLSGSGSTTFGNVTIGQSGTIGAGTTLNANAHNFTVSGTNFTFNHSNSTFNGGSSTVTFNGTADLIGTALNVTGTTAAFYGVTVLNTTTMGIDITVNGPLSILNAANKLVINGNTLSLNGTVSGSGTLTGSSASNLIVGSGGVLGTLSFDQTTSNITNVLKDFTVNSGATAALGNVLNITAGILPGSVTANGTINTGDFLVLKSDINGTSRVAISLGAINGDVTVERYINTGTLAGQHPKAWQLLAIPTDGSQTINQAWQDTATSSNQNRYPGYGTQITGVAGVSVDLPVTSTPSMKTWVPGGSTYVGISGTGIPIYNKKGYFIFIRGDRSVTAFGQNSKPTTLRSKGPLFTQAHLPNSTIVAANNFESVGNPYASALDIRQISKTAGVDEFIYVWDPYLGSSGPTSPYGLGGFVTLLRDINGHYYATPQTATYDGGIHDTLQSGQAFFVFASGGGTVSFDENSKISGDRLVNSPVSNPQIVQQLRTNLYGVNPDGSRFMTDGTLNQFSSNYSNGIDGKDARKNANTSGNLSIKASGSLLAIERRQMVSQQDTIFLNLTGVRAQPYRYEFIAQNMNVEGLQGFVEDTYLHTRTPMDLNGTTIIDFTIVNVPGSYAANRFRIVFTPSVALPVTFTSVKAYRQAANINVEWKVENERNIKNYDVEKSADGLNFKTMVTKAATGNGGNSANYLAADAQPVTGYNYYRIRSNDQDGKTQLTKVVRVLVGTIRQDISIYPNPITDGTIHLQFMNEPEGKYKIRLLNKIGQVILSKEVTRTDGSSTELIKWDFNLAHGMYQLEITKPDGSTKNLNVIY